MNKFKITKSERAELIARVAAKRQAAERWWKEHEWMVTGIDPYEEVLGIDALEQETVLISDLEIGSGELIAVDHIWDDADGEWVRESAVDTGEELVVGRHGVLHEEWSDNNWWLA